MKRVALIGVGMVSDTHRLALEASEHAELAAVCARHPNSARDYAERHGTEAKSLEEIVHDPKIDFAIIATPPKARRDLVVRLAQAQKPILMEKPIERSLAAARDIVELCEAADVPLGIVFQHRTRDVFQTLAGLVDANALGPIGLVEISVPWWREQSYYDAPGRGTFAQDGGGVLITQAIHTLDLALALAGPVTAVQAMARTSNLHQMEAEDTVTAGLEFASGAIGTLTATTAAYPGGAESIALHGTLGSARFETGILQLHWRDGRVETFGVDATSGGGADPMAFTHVWHQTIIDDFALSLDTDQAPIVTGREALKAHALIEAVMRSSQEGKRVQVKDV